MQHKRLKLSALLLFLTGLTGLQAQSLYVKETGGTQTAFSLSSINKISFSQGNITLSKTGSSSMYALNGLRYLSFTDYTTGIPVAETPKGTIQLYPNPVDEVLTIQLPATASRAGTVEILSMEGKVMLTRAISSKTNVYQVNVSVLPQGIYLCKVTNGKTIETTKFLKQ